MKKGRESVSPTTTRPTRQTYSTHNTRPISESGRSSWRVPPSLDCKRIVRAHAHGISVDPAANGAIVALYPFLAGFHDRSLWQCGLGPGRQGVDQAAWPYLLDSTSETIDVATGAILVPVTEGARHGPGRPRSFPVVSRRFASDLAQFQHNPITYSDGRVTSVGGFGAGDAGLRRGEEAHNA